MSLRALGPHRLLWTDLGIAVHGAPCFLGELCTTSIAARAQRLGCPIPVTDADSEAVARDWLLERGFLKESE